MRAGDDLDSEAVVGAAVAVLADGGVDVVSLTRVAAELGVSQPALYRHVDGIDDLWRRLGVLGRGNLADALTEAVIGRSGPDAVRAASRAWRTFALDHAGLYAATDRHPCAGFGDLEAAVERVVSVLAMSLRAYELGDAATIDAARTLRSALHGFVHLELGEGHPHAHDTDASFDTMVEMLCVGFAHLADPSDSIHSHGEAQ